MNDINKRDEEGATALYRSVANRKIDEAKMLLEQGADVEIPYWDGTTPLMLAVLRGNIEMTDLLLSHGADPLKSDSKYGETAMHMVSIGQHGSEIETTIRRKLIEAVSQQCSEYNTIAENAGYQLIDPPLINAVCTKCGGYFNRFADGSSVLSSGHDHMLEAYSCSSCSNLAKFRHRDTDLLATALKPR